MKKTVLIFLCIICILIPIGAYSGGIVKSIKMNVNCLDYLSMAADANSVELAEKYLSIGIDYIEKNNLTQGSTEILIYSPRKDLKLWYENLKSAQSQLKELILKEDLTDLEESNTLMKLRESLLDETGYLIYPTNISTYPNHVGWFWYLCTIWLLWAGAVFFGIFAYEEDY